MHTPWTATMPAVAPTLPSIVTFTHAVEFANPATPNCSCEFSPLTLPSDPPAPSLTPP